MKMRKGFTLVELLIVIIIIGILAAAMLLSSGSASDSATATKAISEMRSIKAAIISYSAERAGVISDDAFSDAKKKTTLAGFMDKDAVLDNYKINFDGNTGTVSIDAQGLTTTAMAKVKESKATEDDGTMTFRIPRVK